MEGIPHIPVFMEEAHPCPYVTGLSSSNLRFFLREWSAELLEILLENGFRHFGGDFFRPECQGCSKCLGLRIGVNEFVPRRIHRRILHRNTDLRRVDFVTPVDKQRLSLLNFYHNWQRISKAWPSTSYDEEKYCESFAPKQDNSLQVGYFDGCGNLVAVSVVDLSLNSINAVYHYYSPMELSRSLGIWMILQEIIWAKTKGLQWLHLGIYNPQCPSLAYKAGFYPHQILRDGQWSHVHKPNFPGGAV